MAFCRNCGNQMDDLASICVKCGVAKGNGNAFCPNCGQPTVPGAAVCTSCGVALNNTIEQKTSEKSKMAAGLLGIFLGAWGIHNFYLGNTNRGVIQLVLTLVTCGVAGIWGVIEGILILCGNINTDAKGNKLKD